MLMLLGMLLAIDRLTAAEPEGAVVFSAKLYDLGELSVEDDKQLLRVPFTNVSDKPLVVLEVRTSCSCTTVEYARGKILPGERGVLNVTVDPSKAPVGNFYRVLQIVTTASETPSNITLKAVITN